MLLEPHGVLLCKQICDVCKQFCDGRASASQLLRFTSVHNWVISFRRDDWHFQVIPTMFYKIVQFVIIWTNKK